MGEARDVRSSAAQGTLYAAFETRREQKEGYAPSEADLIIGRSPLTRWVARYFTFEDLDDSFQAKVRLPHNAILTGRVGLLINEAFDGAGAATSNIGDGTDPDGWFAAVDLTGTAGTMLTAAGAYAGSFKRAGAADTIIATVGTGASAQGGATLFVEVVAYAEELDAEDNLA